MARWLLQRLPPAPIPLTPALMAAGLLAKKAVERGLQPQPWVKASLAPGSKVVSDYLAHAGLTPYLDQLWLQSGGIWLHHLYR